MTICLASTDRDIQEIRDLQEANLKDNIPLENRLSDGFLTAKYELDFLREMNGLTPNYYQAKRFGCWICLGYRSVIISATSSIKRSGHSDQQNSLWW